MAAASITLRFDQLMNLILDLANKKSYFNVLNNDFISSGYSKDKLLTDKDNADLIIIANQYLPIDSNDPTEDEMNKIFKKIAEEIIKKGYANISKNILTKDLNLHKIIFDSLTNFGGITGTGHAEFRKIMKEELLNNPRENFSPKKNDAYWEMQPASCDKTFRKLQKTTFRSKDCSSGNEIDTIVKNLCESQKGGYFGVGGTTPNDLAGMLMTGGANFIDSVKIDNKNYTNTLIDTLNKLINQVQEKGMIINDTDKTRLNTLMNTFAKTETEVIKDIQTLYKLYENSKYLEKDVLTKNPDGATRTIDYDVFNLNPLDKVNMKELTDKLSEYKKTEGKLLLTYDKLLSCLKSSSP